jgi:MarR family transcriptional regulator, organic hydroperoxide resistance regulator
MLDITYYGDMTSSGSPVAHPARPAEQTVADDTWTRLVEVCLGVVREHFVRTVASFDLSVTQAQALRCLDPGRALPMGEVAEQLKCDPSNITGVVDRLEARGLVERRAAPHDRRVKTLVLTEQGALLRERLSAQMFGAPAAVALLPLDDQQRLGEILQRVLDACGSPVDQLAYCAPPCETEAPLTPN